MNIGFDDKVAIVTGAGNGLGRCYAIELARRGALVVVNDWDSPAALEVVEEIRSWGGSAVADFNSVAEESSSASIVKTALDTYGKVDILVNNAGILMDKRFSKMTAEDFDQVIKVHLYGSYFLTRAAFPLMREQGFGRIVMTTSTAGLYGNFGQANYGAAKLGIVGLMGALRDEGSRYNVLINTVAPLAATRMTIGTFPPEILAHMRTEHVAALVLYLCSEVCITTGQVISAGTGFYARDAMMEGRGYRFENAAVITPEMIAAKYEVITDLSEAITIDSAGASVLRIVEPIFNKIKNV